MIRNSLEEISELLDTMGKVLKQGIDVNVETKVQARLMEAVHALRMAADICSVKVCTNCSEQQESGKLTFYYRKGRGVWVNDDYRMLIHRSSDNCYILRLSIDYESIVSVLVMTDVVVSRETDDGNRYLDCRCKSLNRAKSVAALLSSKLSTTVGDHDEGVAA